MSEYLLTVKRVYRRTEGTNLKQAVGSTWNDGDSIYVETVVDYSKTGGVGVFEPETVREEEFDYGGIDEATNRLLEVSRPNTLFAHADGTFLQAGSTAVSEMLIDGYQDDEERIVVATVPSELEMTLQLGRRDQESMEVVPVTNSDDGDLVITGGPQGTPLVYRTDSGGVEIDTETDTITIGADGSLELDDVAGSPPPGRAGTATLFFDSLGAGGSGVYYRPGTAAPVKL